MKASATFDEIISLCVDSKSNSIYMGQLERHRYGDGINANLSILSHLLQEKWKFYLVAALRV